MEGRTFVIGVDGSDNADKAFNWMLDYLVGKNDNVVVVHCAELTIPFSTQDAVSISNAMAEEHKKIDILIAKYAEILKKRGIAGRAMRIDGQKPGEAIISTAASCNANMIVTGTRGLGSIRRTILGSVSDYIVKHATVPVTIYRD